MNGGRMSCGRLSSGQMSGGLMSGGLMSAHHIIHTVPGPGMTRNSSIFVNCLW